MVCAMRPEDYPHPERLNIPDQLVVGSPKDWEVVGVLTANATIPFDVAVILKTKPDPETVFEMKLARVNESGITTRAWDVINFEHREDYFELHHLLRFSLFFKTDDPRLTQMTEKYKALGHGQKIRELDTQLDIYGSTLTAAVPFIPAWRETAKALAPYVAAFFRDQPEGQPDHNPFPPTRASS